MRLSIITINYNNKVGLKRTIDSILSQSWNDFEWIVIDGGSNDGSYELIENNSKAISYSVSEKDNGVYHAMNKGISHAKGDYLLFMNSGDTFYSRDTLSQVFVLNHTEDILYGDWLIVYKDHEHLEKYSPKVDFFVLRKRNICQQAMFIKNSILKKDGFDESYKLLADWKRWTDAALTGASFKYLGIPICRYDAYGISSGSNPLKEIEYERIKSSYPKILLELMSKVYYYENYHHIVHIKALLEKGGLPAYLTKIFMKIMYQLFL